MYKDALVPRRFSNNSLPPYFPLVLHLPTRPPRRTSGRVELHLLPAAPGSPQNRYDLAS
jgi:hypothetical protein